MHSSLTFRQERFVFEFLKDQNASAAAARAGYTAKNMAAQGNELMSNPAIADRVRFEMQSMLAEIRVSAIDLMKQRARIAFFDPGKMVDGWEPVALETMDAETRSALEVSTVTRKGGPVVRVKQGERHKALRALERVHEKMEQLNERYTARLERAGLLPTLEEIEAMDQGGADVAGVTEMPGEASSEKDQVLSGGQAAAGEPAPVAFLEKHQVLSGAAGGTTKRVPAFSEKPMVLSGLNWVPRIPSPSVRRDPVAAAVSAAFAIPGRARGVGLAIA